MGALSDSIAQLHANDRQWEAFMVPGHCVVLAPPGSGKTKLLTTRLAYDLQNRIVPPQGAACITLTNAAADELRRRVEQLGVRPRASLFVGTVHGFALRRIIAPFARLVGHPQMESVSIASEAQIKQAFDQAIGRVYYRGSDTRNVRSTIEINWKRFATDEEWARHSDRIREVARLYRQILHGRGLHDFQEIVEYAVSFVESHSSIRKVLTSRFPHLYVDEYQDLAPGLDRLVRALCFDYKRGSELFAVGDPDQAVFAFTGTRPELLRQLSGSPSVTTVMLDRNYRCGEEIIRVANLMRRSPDPPVVGIRTGGTVSVAECLGGLADQARSALAVIANAQKRGVPLQEVAVLCPTNYICRRAAEALRVEGVPAVIRESEYRSTPATLLVEGAAAWSVLGRERSGHRLGDLVRRWRLLHGDAASRSSDVAFTEMLMSWGSRAEESAATFVQTMLLMGLKNALNKSVLAEDRLQVSKMFEALESGNLREMSVRGLADRARRTGRVEVTTMTSSKGLEFDVVILLAVNEKLMPHFLSEGDSEKLNEDRRKFYVSLTRARDEVWVFYSPFVEWESGKVGYARPSRFLREMGVLRT